MKPGANRQIKALALKWFFVIFASAMAPPGWADTLDDIMRRGKLVVGVKMDVPLWGQLDVTTGKLVGLEPDLATDLARRLGVELELVGLLTADRIAAVEQRRVDVLIATLSDTEERQQQVTLVAPHYYASGVNILARRAEGFRTWSDLRNRRVCGRRGTFYNRSITVNYGADIVALYSNELAVSALRDGRCAALLYDDTGIVTMLLDPAWSQNYQMPLETLFVTPWSLALNAQERGGRLESLVSDAIVDWHRSGLILQLERKWGIPTTTFTSRMNELWNRKVNGHYFCGERVSQSTPGECL